MSGGDNERPALDEMAALAARYGEALDELTAVVGAVQAVQRAAVRERLDALQLLASRTRERRGRLLELVREHPGLFARPRSRIVAGIRFGWRKSAGRITVGKSTLALIRAKLAGRAPELIRQTEAVNLDALRGLSARELALVGATLTHSTDAPFAAAARSDVEQLAASLLRAATEEDA